MNAAEIANARGGIPCSGGFLISCVCAGHGKGRGDRRPSLSIADGEDGRLLVQCFAGCDPRDVLDEFRRMGLLDDLPRRDREAPPRRAAPTVRPEPEPDEAAVEIWRAAEPMPDSLAARYLVEHRHLEGPFPPSLRFSRGVPYPRAGLRLPALVAAVQRPTDRRIVAVQVTYLNAATGAKANVSTPRWTFGALGTGCIRLAAAGPVLGIAEGTETALAAMQLSGLPCWAVLGSQRLASVWLPPEAVEIHVFADNDAPGQQCAEKAAERFTREGRRVLIRTPAKEYGDWADVAASMAREDAA